MDSSVKRYVEYYNKKQHGGSATTVPGAVYRGARHWGVMQQQGGSNADVRSLVGLIGPALAHGAATFFADTATGYSKGKSVGDAATSAIAPALMSAVRSVANRATTQQGGGGRKRKRQSGGGKKKRAKKRRTAQKGRGVVSGDAGASKPKRRKRKSKRSKSKSGKPKKRKQYKRLGRKQQSFDVNANF
jgi:hypothetical protein